MMIEIAGIFIDKKDDVSATFRKSAREFLDSFTLDRSLVYDVGMDQSNSCTGITIESVDSSFIIILEVINHGLEFEAYRRGLVKILATVFENVSIRYYIMEEPLPYISGRRNAHLTRLKNVLKDFFKSNILDIKKFDSILPQAWRAGLIGKDNPYDKRSKSACVHEVIKLHPKSEEFKSLSHSSDYDGFESCGILNGYKLRHGIKESDTITKIIGPKNTTKIACAFYSYSNAESKELAEMIEFIKSITSNLSPMVQKYYNDEESMYANAKMSLVDDFTATVVTNTFDILCMLARFNLEYDERNALFMIVVPYTKIKDSFKEYIKTIDLNIEIYY